MTKSAVLERRTIVQSGRRLEYFTIGWNTHEGLVAIAAGAIAESVTGSLSSVESTLMKDKGEQGIMLSQKSHKEGDSLQGCVIEDSYLAT